MTDKKDPGKFTIRFNICDPQHKAVIDLLNRQGRSKAQFLVSAVLHYHKLNVRLHFTHSDTNIIFLPICIISQCHELRCCKCKFSRIHLSVKNRP